MVGNPNPNDIADFHLYSKDPRCDPRISTSIIRICGFLPRRMCGFLTSSVDFHIFSKDSVVGELKDWSFLVE
jgi:hypothetical protein